MSSKKWKVDMRDIRNMLALVAKDQYSAREVAESIGISHQSVLETSSQVRRRWHFGIASMRT